MSMAGLDQDVLHIFCARTSERQWAGGFMNTGLRIDATSSGGTDEPSQATVR